MIWKPARGLEHRFKISNTGLVRSVANYRRDDTILKPVGSDYFRVSYWKNGRDTKVLVHRMVAETFIPNPDNKRFVNHKDANKRNNHFTNLEWVTASENSKHAYDNGLTTLIPKSGVEHHNAKLNPTKVLEIRRKYQPRIYSQRKLAREYRVDQHTIMKVLQNETWVVT